MVSKKLSSYQKLKLENKQLRVDIYKLVIKENEETGIITKIKYKISFDIDNQICYGLPENAKLKDN